MLLAHPVTARRRGGACSARAGFLVLTVAFAVCQPSAPRAQAPAAGPTLAQVVERIGQYVAAYGEKAAVIVGVEKYAQRDDTGTRRSRRLVAEFAIARVASGPVHWLGFRDVVEVDGQAVVDRRGRLLALLTQESADGMEFRRIADESARFNVGPISRNFNVPTTTLFFMEPQNLPRFQFTLKGTEKIDGVETWALNFKETRTPTFITTAKGANVPMEGTLWVVPDDGTVVRTRLQLRGFADGMTEETVTLPAATPALIGSEVSSGNVRRQVSLPVRVQSVVTIEVMYRHDARLDMWLPSHMSEEYEGPTRWGAGAPSMGRATTVADYSDYKRFETGAKIVFPK